MASCYPTQMPTLVQSRRFWGGYHKAFGVFLVSLVEYLLTLQKNGISSVIMDIGRSKQNNSGMMRVMVVPV